MNIRDIHPDAPLFTGLVAVPECELESLKRRWLFVELLQVSVAEEINGGQCLLAWVYRLLGSLPFVSAEAAQLIVAEAQVELRAQGHLLGLWLTKKVPAVAACPTLAFAETKFVTWSGAAGWLALDTGRRLAKLPVTPLETIGYNLAELFRRQYQRCKHGRDATTTGVSPGVD